MLDQTPSPNYAATFYSHSLADEHYLWDGEKSKIDQFIVIEHNKYISCEIFSHTSIDDLGWNWWWSYFELEYRRKSFAIRGSVQSRWCYWICWMSQWIADTEHLWTAFRAAHANMPWKCQLPSAHPLLSAAARLRNCLRYKGKVIIKMMKWDPKSWMTVYCSTYSFRKPFSAGPSLKLIHSLDRFPLLAFHDVRPHECMQ